MPLHLPFGSLIVAMMFTLLFKLKTEIKFFKLENFYILLK